MCFMGFKFTDPHWYLYRGDKLGMAHSIELRSPFLDYEFVNFALSIPGSMKVKNNEPKYILKNHSSLFYQKMYYTERKWASVYH